MLDPLAQVGYGPCDKQECFWIAAFSIICAALPRQYERQGRV
jgi:hypothetical protein